MLDSVMRSHGKILFILCILAAVLIPLFAFTGDNTVPVYHTYPGVVVLDAGHGGSDSGARGSSTNVREDGLNLAVVKKLETIFTANGYKVIMTREDEEALGFSKAGDMAARREIIEQSGADIVISIHMNQFSDAGVCGPQVFYCKNSPEGEKLAKSIQECMNDMLEPERPRTHLPEQYYILRSGEYPCALVECGFLSNPREEELLQSDEYQQRIAEAVYAGAAAYLKEDTKDIAKK